MTIFVGTGRQMRKMDTTFSMGNGVLNIVFKFFPQKSAYRLNESQKTSFEGTFSPIPVVLLGRLLTKIIGLTYGWTRIYHVNFMKISSKLRPLSCGLIHIFVIKYLQNKKRVLSHSPLSAPLQWTRNSNTRAT